jgi:hypothetical protein
MSLQCPSRTSYPLLDCDLLADFHAIHFSSRHPCPPIHLELFNVNGQIRFSSVISGTPCHDNGSSVPVRVPGLSSPDGKPDYPHQRTHQTRQMISLLCSLVSMYTLYHPEGTPWVHAFQHPSRTYKSGGRYAREYSLFYHYKSTSSCLFQLIISSHNHQAVHRLLGRSRDTS